MSLLVDEIKNNASSYVRMGEGFKSLRIPLILTALFWWLIFPLIPLYKKVKEIRESALKITLEYRDINLIKFANSLGKNLIFIFVAAPIISAVVWWIIYGNVIGYIIRDEWAPWRIIPWTTMVLTFIYVTLVALALLFSIHVYFTANMFAKHCENLYNPTKSFLFKEIQHEFKEIMTIALLFFFICLVPFTFLITCVYIGGKLECAGDRLIHVFMYEVDKIES